MSTTLKSLIEESGWTVEEAPKFLAWFREVNRLVEGKIGLSIDCIGDWGYADAYEDGLSPKGAAARVVSLFNSGEL